MSDLVAIQSVNALTGETMWFRLYDSIWTHHPSRVQFYYPQEAEELIEHFAFDDAVLVPASSLP